MSTYATNFYYLTYLNFSHFKMSSNNQDDMDALVAAMSHNVEVAEYTVSLEHPRYSQYKNYGAEVQHQKKRRSDWLQRHKEYVCFLNFNSSNYFCLILVEEMHFLINADQILSVQMKQLQALKQMTLKWPNLKISILQVVRQASQVLGNVESIKEEKLAVILKDV